MTSIKVIAEEPQFSSLPPSHPYFKTQNGLESVNAGPEDSIPTIDFALLTMGTPDQRSKVIHDLGKACEEWGFFLVCPFMKSSIWLIVIVIYRYSTVIHLFAVTDSVRGGATWGRGLEGAQAPLFGFDFLLLHMGYFLGKKYI